MPRTSPMSSPKIAVPALAAAVALGVLGIGPVGAGGAAADTLLTILRHSDAFDAQGRQQPARDETVELWIGKDRIYRGDGSKAVILRGDKNDVVLINRDNDTYTVLGLPIDFDAMLPAEARRDAEMWKMSAQVTPTEETKKIGDWNARLYELDLTNPAGLAIHTELWTTRDLPIDYDRFKQLSMALASLQPGGAEAAADLGKIDGFPVYQEIAVDMGPTTARSSEKLDSAVEKDPPAGIYDPPAGYREEPFRPGPPPGAGG